MKKCPILLTYKGIIFLDSKLKINHCSQCYSESVFRELLTTIAAKILYDPKWPHDVDQLYTNSKAFGKRKHAPPCLTSKACIYEKSCAPCI